jgi:isopentenyl diphosphate isomerase/L-lactate dehydrogenase-like FMN-dependent dehydrogenase
MLEMLNDELRLAMVLTHSMKVSEVTAERIIQMIEIEKVLAKL